MLTRLRKRGVRVGGKRIARYSMRIARRSPVVCAARKKRFIVPAPAAPRMRIWRCQRRFVIRCRRTGCGAPMRTDACATWW